MSEFTTCGACGQRLYGEAVFCQPCELAFCSADCFEGHMKLHRLAERAEALFHQHWHAEDREHKLAAR